MRLLALSVALLLVLSFFYARDPLLVDILGLAWDCGAVTTGPVTVPLVLALGIGVCRIVGDEDAGGSGFGVFDGQSELHVGQCAEEDPVLPVDAARVRELADRLK